MFNISLLYSFFSFAVFLMIAKHNNMMGAADTTKTISTHILDTSLGKTAANVPVSLYRLDSVSGNWTEVSQAVTNADGRVEQLIAPNMFNSGIYKLNFKTSNYYAAQNMSSFYPFIEIVFECTAGEHYHVPLLLNPYGYSTYRGS